MTRDLKDPTTVRLSVRDYVTLGAAIVTISGVFLGAYLRHDRLLSEVLAMQRTQGERIEKLEQSLDSVERLVWQNQKGGPR